VIPGLPVMGSQTTRSELGYNLASPKQHPIHVSIGPEIETFRTCANRPAAKTQKLATDRCVARDHRARRKGCARPSPLERRTEKSRKIHRRRGGGRKIQIKIFTFLASPPPRPPLFQIFSRKPCQPMSFTARTVAARFVLVRVLAHDLRARRSSTMHT